MSEQSENKQIESEEIEIPQALLEEARIDIAQTVKEFQILNITIHKNEEAQKQLRQKKAELLREHPWLGNIQGVINKEATKAAKKSLIPPEDQPAVAPPASSGKKQVEVIPRKKDVQAVQAAKSSRTRLERNIRKATETKKPSQFTPDHPSYKE